MNGMKLKLYKKGKFYVCRILFSKNRPSHFANDLMTIKFPDSYGLFEVLEYLKCLASDLEE